MIAVFALLGMMQAPEFNREVRPILSDKCWQCHSAEPQLRLNLEGTARAAREKIVARVKSGTMPPKNAARKLEPGEAETLIRWAENGAPWEKHWAYLPPRRKSGLSIDALAHPVGPRAGRETLMRRVMLDLTGLPPTIEELDSNLSYAQVVERALASPRYAERMAAKWLDAARYADTNGYQTDGERVMWRWRDWVIEAFRKNMPFDQFVVEQMAGDLLPGATLEQKIATGFQRNHRGNGEGGIVEAEFVVEYAVDRLETMATVMLGSTIGCARCHDHKYDPFPQKEFYQLLAYFDHIGDRGRYWKFGNTPPWVSAPTAEQAARLAMLDAAIAAAEKKLKPGVAKGPLDWKPVLDRKAVSEAAPSYTEGFTIAARMEMGPGDVFRKAAEGEDPAGVRLFVRDGHIAVELVARWLDDAIRVESERKFGAGEKHHVAFTYAGTKTAAGLKLYVDGREEKYRVNLDDLNQDFTVKDAVKTGRWPVEYFARALEPVEVSFLAGTAAGEQARRRQWLETAGKREWGELVRLRREREALVREVPTVMVMQEVAHRPPTHLLLRGAYDRPGEVVERGLPAVFGGARPKDRLELARWMVSRENPLLARVTVNRVWQMLFGTGLVKTVEDFGSQGEWPAQQELLDWLAVELMENGWDLKALIRTIVLSETYQQKAAPRLRLDAGQIRDQALYVAGLLVEKVGGPSVKPYQPAGLWKELSGGADYVTDKGEGLYRRSLYTFWKRTSPPPAMANFDAAAREMCTVRETRTNTPLQALNLMNDVTFLEAARKLAERLMVSGGGVEMGFRMVTGRRPDEKERVVLKEALEAQRAKYRNDEQAARSLLAHGDSQRDGRLDVRELAAMTMVASLLLNLDEGITRE
jgi:hypothetical protein